MNPKISIIIPVYNVAGYLENCLDSILAQTFQDFDVYIVDDGSTDETPAICDRYAAQNEKITVIHKKNEGVSIARNVAIEQAKGDYFVFFDGDDHVEPECLEEMYQAAVSKNADSVIAGYYFEKNGKIDEVFLPTMEKDVYEGEEIMTDLMPRFIGVSLDDIRHWIKGDKKNPFQKENSGLWHSMVKGDLIRDNNVRFIPWLRVGEDTCFNVAYMSYAKRCVVVHKCYYYLVDRSTSTISVYRKSPMAVLQNKIDLPRARRQLTEEIKERLDLNIENDWYGTVVMSCFQLAILFGRRDPELKLKERYRAYRSYIDNEDTQNAIAAMNVKFEGIKAIPFFLLKRKHYLLIFLAASLIGIGSHQLIDKFS